MNPTIEIGAATIGDATRAAKIWVAANRLRRAGRFDEDLAGIVQLIERRISSDALFVIARDAGRPVAIACLMPARENDGSGPIIPRVTHLSMVAVDPQHWGRGIGRIITGHCVNHAVKLGCTSIQLWTHVSNERAQRLYTSVGFQAAGREKQDARNEQIRLYVLRLDD